MLSERIASFPPYRRSGNLVARGRVLVARLTKTITGIMIPVMVHIEAELARITDRLSQSPDPFEHAGLYAAQQALSWAAQPDCYASPFATITGIRATSAGCYPDNRPPLSLGNSDTKLDAA